MKNRREEYEDLLEELAQSPKALNGSVARARKRARRSQLLHRLTAPVTTAAAAAVCFVLTVNIFPTFALACSGIPIIRELAAAAAFSPSLSAAVAHEYVQYIGQSQTVDGIKAELGYAIIDRYQVVFFYRVDGGMFYTAPELIGENGEHIGGYATQNVPGESENGLDSMILSFSEQSVLPEKFTIKLFLTPDQGTEAADAPFKAPTEAGDSDIDPKNDPGVLCFPFDVTLDLDHVAQPVGVPVGRWLELDGQRILVDRLEFTPTRTVLYLEEAQCNTAWLKSLKFWFEDAQGNRYRNSDGVLSASGTGSSKSFLTYYFQSFYYDPPKGLTLCVDKAEWLDKKLPHVLVNLISGEADGLPKGVEIGKIRRVGNDVELEILSPSSRKHFSQTFDHTYWDPEGGAHEWNRISFTTQLNDDGQEAAQSEVFFLDGYPWDTVELALSYTSVTEYAQPIRVPLRED